MLRDIDDSLYGGIGALGDDVKADHDEDVNTSTFAADFLFPRVVSEKAVLTVRQVRQAPGGAEKANSPPVFRREAAT
ncbi:hypothetical protein [Streptomyces morookaense]|uniref:Uncharacterized protein n=1 Tax=Streptomyces morookaense TaxID=1970 RepID=A0A7Y7B4U6_STRMO|nr:hypothetical protein [Streptomyces morookaense]NVK79040.1 hypothetical protein [Streptomyces morookaense]GHF09893.1 hypothetical protein GCM10010359_09200 [Streptomyces morookaense]